MARSEIILGADDWFVLSTQNQERNFLIHLINLDLVFLTIEIC